MLSFKQTYKRTLKPVNQDKNFKHLHCLVHFGKTHYYKGISHLHLLKHLNFTRYFSISNGYFTVFKFSNITHCT